LYLLGWVQVLCSCQRITSWCLHLDCFLRQEPSDSGLLDLGGIGRTDLESPLHVLGDAALDTFGRNGSGRLNISGKRPRKRPAGLGIQVCFLIT